MAMCAGALRSLDECGEKGVVSWMRTKEPFRVPLNSDDEGGGRQLCCFEDAIRCVGGNDQTGRGAVDRLVVIRIDHK